MPMSRTNDIYVKLGHSHDAATKSADGFMTAGDKAQLEKNTESIGDVSKVLDEINGTGTIKPSQKIVFVANAILWGADGGNGQKYLMPNEGIWSDIVNVGDLVVLCKSDASTYAPETQLPYSNGDIYKVAKIGVVNQGANGVILEDLPLANIGGGGNARYEYSQTDLEAGVSELAEGKLYFVYE